MRFPMIIKRIVALVLCAISALNAATTPDAAQTPAPASSPIAAGLADRSLSSPGRGASTGSNVNTLKAFRQAAAKSPFLVSLYAGSLTPKAPAGTSPERLLEVVKRLLESSDGDVSRAISFGDAPAPVVEEPAVDHQAAPAPASDEATVDTAAPAPASAKKETKTFVGKKPVRRYSFSAPTVERPQEPAQGSLAEGDRPRNSDVMTRKRKVTPVFVDNKPKRRHSFSVASSVRQEAPARRSLEEGDRPRTSDVITRARNQEKSLLLQATSLVANNPGLAGLTAGSTLAAGLIVKAVVDYRQLIVKGGKLEGFKAFMKKRFASLNPREVQTYIKLGVVLLPLIGGGVQLVQHVQK